eukprot:gnl/TRDRNA2_/TRDRNA2_191853_c0_seq1.p1 gnl/TRDRNA2_/TRDRNA2_191853_c0~~gnl/TRDRNA2_/TRDRNA2_191853_c0_seq1.p1  ORF type:complete len:812 (+),score=169.45 gnl/TRDRNA2_/TRDRNA2_191853_c0_seq1:79-2436(+)
MGDAQSQQLQQQQRQGMTTNMTPMSPNELQAGGTACQLQSLDQLQEAQPGQLCESALLAQLVQLLGQRHKHSLLLSDLGALLPVQLRTGVKEKGGLRSWLQKYSELFHVSGQPGKESVTLVLGNMDSNASAPVANSTALAGEAAGPYDATDDENQSAVQLRGLPYRATVADIKAFLGSHTQTLKDENSVQLVLNRDGRPSGFARVQFNSPASAKAARDELHMRHMEVGAGANSNATTAQATGQNSGPDRYVEIFLYSERPNKLRFKKATSETLAGCAVAGEPVDPEMAGVTKEQVVHECREHMKSPGKGQLLLSMLGVALSQGARMYLKRTDQGLKHFLAQYPHEFMVDSAKGRECVIYLPANIGCADVMLPYETKQETQQRGRKAASTSNVSSAAAVPKVALEPQHRDKDDSKSSMEDKVPALPQTPQPAKNAGSPEGTPSVWGTPSNWGTPWPQQAGDTTSSSTSTAAPAAAAPFPPPGAAPGPYGNWPACWGPPQPAMWPPPPLGMWPPHATMPWALAAVPPEVSNGQNPQLSWAHEGALAAMAQADMLGLKAASGGAQAKSAPASSNHVAVRLRGLPFTAGEQDVLAFFAKHDVVELIADEAKAVRMISKASGKPSGQSVVLMKSKAHAETAQKALHGQWISTRYIEVFLHHEDGEEGAAEKKLGQENQASKASPPQQQPQPAKQAPPPVPMWGGPPHDVGIDWRFGAAGDTGGSDHAGLIGGGRSSFPAWPPMPTKVPGDKAPAAPQGSWDSLFDFPVWKPDEDLMQVGSVGGSARVESM